MRNSKWLFKDISTVKVEQLSDEDLLSLYDFVNKRLFRHASHLIRLLKMGSEFLGSGELQIDRPEKHQLIEIKKGLWTLEQVKELAKELFRTLEYAYINSKLKSKPDYDKANELLISITEDFLNEQ